MKTFILSLFFLLLFTTTLFSQNEDEKDYTIYQYTVEDIYGDDFDFNELFGKKVMIVNTASKCGYTPQYEELEKLYQRFKDKNFIIVGFPSNDFGKQEPGTNEEIAQFCKKNYGVTFPMMSKITVVGKNKHSIYRFLTEKSKNNVLDTKVRWNFQKYLIDERGYLIKEFSSNVSPLDKEIVEWIKK